ncbi:MAG: SDR family NAD(P)-dependent oxidoreductase [Balneolaceae bacterium]
MKSLKNKIIVVVGGTGNVGSFLVKELLKNEATVAVPSRSVDNIDSLKKHLAKELEEEIFSRLHFFVGDIGDEDKSEEVLDEITHKVGTPHGAIAALGKFIPAPSLLNASVNDLKQVVDGYLMGHFVVAQTFLKKFKDNGGTYIFINGPLALKPWEGSGADLVSIATAGQKMLFESLALELKNTDVKLVELITHAFIRNKETQPGSPIPGEAVGAYASYLFSDEAKDVYGKTVQLRSMSQIKEVGL